MHRTAPRVAGGQKYEVAYEAKKTKKKAATVRKAVKKVGNSRKKVNKALSGALIMSKPAIKTCSDHAFHVDHNEAQDRWDVVDQEGKVMGHCHTQGEAIDLAIPRSPTHAQPRR